MTMKLNKSRVTIAAIIFVLLLSSIIGGVVWTIREGIYSAQFERCRAEVTACLTETVEESDDVIVTDVTVHCTASSGEQFDAQFVGDLSQCRVGQVFDGYFRTADTSVVYPRRSDLGFALIMLCGSLVCMGIYVVAIVGLSRSGEFLSHIYDFPIN